jgi:hypothetical protein
MSAFTVKNPSTWSSGSGARVSRGNSSNVFKAGTTAPRQRITQGHTFTSGLKKASDYAWLGSKLTSSGGIKHVAAVTKNPQTGQRVIHNSEEFGVYKTRGFHGVEQHRHAQLTQRNVKANADLRALVVTENFKRQLSGQPRVRTGIRHTDVERHFGQGLHPNQSFGYLREQADRARANADARAALQRKRTVEARNTNTRVRQEWSRQDTDRANHWKTVMNQEQQKRAAQTATGAARANARTQS